MNPKSRYELKHPNIPKPKRGSGVVGAQQTLSQITEKKDLNVMDYIILLSTMYGIGSGIGIIAGTANSVLPKRQAKPAVYYTCIALLIAGATRGYITAMESQKLKTLLQELNLSNDKMV